VASAGQFSEPFDHGVPARAEALRKSPDLGRSARVSERPVNGNAQILKVHNAILADGRPESVVWSADVLRGETVGMQVSSQLVPAAVR
jgi:hypothetical protein